MKKFISILLSLCMIVSITAGIDLTANATIYSGKCTLGDLTWTLDTKTGEFVVRGSGYMTDELGSSGLPWYPYYEYIKTVTITEGVKSIGSYSFENCTSLKSIKISDTVTKIGRYAFSGCSSLSSVVMTDSVATIGMNAFYNCTSLKNIILSKNLTTIGMYAFSGSGLKNIMIPNGIKSISDWTFSACKSLKSVSIPNSVESICYCAFQGSAVDTVYYSGTAAEWKKIKIGQYNEQLESATRHYISADGCTHSWDSGIVTENATCSSTGVKVCSCKICGETTTKSIAKTSHKYKDVVTKASTSKNGKITPTCTVCGAKATATTIYYPKTIELSKTSYIYDGKEKKPSVTVKDSSGKKIASGNYTISYAKGRKNVGTYSVVVSFKGNYSGTETLYFSINPKAATISSVTAASKSFTVKWKKQATQTTGYEIQYATDSKFTKNKKTVTVSKNSITSKKITGLKAKTKYYVRLRAYQSIKANGKATKIYSSWSETLTVTTKK